MLSMDELCRGGVIFLETYENRFFFSHAIFSFDCFILKGRDISRVRSTKLNKKSKSEEFHFGDLLMSRISTFYPHAPP